MRWTAPLSPISRETIVQRQEDAVLGAEIAYGELTVTVPPSLIPEFLRYLRTDAAAASPR